ncbi:hypothetical protein O7609_03185 [Streptomyces sp. WMMC1477]|nr:hypothetical protein [Streptomyces sp. WMMC1477]MCZ7430696.1 hypothetical protein [Streptomyces sp. WMMC1477]
MIGDPAYDVVAVGLFVTRGDPHLLARLTRQYGRTFEPAELLAHTLLHVYGNVPWYYGNFRSPPSPPAPPSPRPGSACGDRTPAWSRRHGGHGPVRRDTPPRVTCDRAGRGAGEAWPAGGRRESPVRSPDRAAAGRT